MNIEFAYEFAYDTRYSAVVLVVRNVSAKPSGVAYRTVVGSVERKRQISIDIIQ